MLDVFPDLGSWFQVVINPILNAFKQDAIASTLAAGILAAGVAFMAVFLGLVVRRYLQIRSATQLVLATDGPTGFLRELGSLSEHLDKLGPIGQAWRSFKATLVPPLLHEQRAEIRGTLPPSNFFHRAGIGQHWKFFRALPNLFVGIGLLLTFLGLVAALTFTTRAIDGAGSPDQTQQALKDLLHATSFKFFTSVAGLLVSIVFTVVLKLAEKWLDASLAGLCRAIGSRVHLVTLTEIAIQQLCEAQQQTADLKLFNDEVAIQVGKQVEQALNASLPTAMLPIAQALDRVTDKISNSSQSAIETMVADFSRQLQGNVGQNIGGLAETLTALQSTLTAVNDSITATGRRLAEQVDETVSNLQQATIDMATAMRDASARAESGLETSRATLEAQVVAVGANIAQQARAASEDGERQIRDAAGGLAGVVADIGGNLSGTVASLTQALLALSEQMHGMEARVAEHRRALEGITQSTHQAGTAIANSAASFREASAPIVEIGRVMGQATKTVQHSIDDLQALLTAGRDDAHKIQEQLSATIAASEKAWRDYEARFGQVDTALGGVLERIVGQSKDSLSLLDQYVQNLSKHIGTGMDHLSGGIEDLGEQVTELKQVVGGLRR